MKCPACGYYAFNGIECFDCGYRCRGRTKEGKIMSNSIPWDEWLQTVKDKLQNLGYSKVDLDEIAWREFYDEGSCPEDAVFEELSAY